MKKKGNKSNMYSVNGIHFISRRVCIARIYPYKKENNHFLKISTGATILVCQKRPHHFLLLNYLLSGIPRAWRLKEGFSPRGEEYFTTNVVCGDNKKAGWVLGFNCCS